MIILNSISKKYGDLQVLKNFNLTLEDNKITCLFGPSGIGKTTIANIIAKLNPIDSGQIYGIDNAVYSYVFQEPRLLNWYSVYDNIDFVLKDIFNVNQRINLINSYIEMVGLSEYKDYKPNSLSGGMAQRVALARAFAYPSNILIMDEPFKGLDIKLKQEMISLFQRLWNESNRTVLFITHDLDEAILLSHYIYIMENRPAEIIKRIDTISYTNNEAIKKILMSFNR